MIFNQAVIFLNLKRMQPGHWHVSLEHHPVAAPLMHSSLGLLSSGLTEIIVRSNCPSCSLFFILSSCWLVSLFGFFQILLSNASQSYFPTIPPVHLSQCWVLLSVLSSGNTCFLYTLVLLVGLRTLSQSVHPLSWRPTHCLSTLHINSAMLWGNSIDVSIAATAVVCLIFQSSLIQSLIL